LHHIAVIDRLGSKADNAIHGWIEQVAMIGGVIHMILAVVSQKASLSSNSNTSFKKAELGLTRIVADDSRQHSDGTQPINASSCGSSNEARLCGGQ
jgi:hypothetical protein